ncbi:MAG: hypothetical protein IH606_03445 [Burkholderiales bacterium]|nr:hypothetical protein [Burkholderiales bacterium]
MFRFALLALFCFSAVYSIKIAVIPVTLGIILWPICAILLFWRRPAQFIPQVTKGGVSLPFIWISALFVYSVCISILRGGGQDFSVPYNFSVWALLFVPSAFLLVAAVQEGAGGGLWRGMDIQDLLVIVILSQSVFIYWSFVSVEFRGVSSSILGDLSEGTLDIGGSRVKGFSNGGGALLSLTQAIGAALSVKLFIERDRWRYVFFAAVVAGSTLLTARTGLMFIALFLAMYLPYCIISRRIRWRIFLFVIAIGGLLSFYLYNNFVEDNYKILFEEYVLTRSFDIFVSMFSGEVGENSAVQAIANMYVVPDTFAGLIFGSGLFTVGGIGYVGDPGYIKYINYFGLLGCLGMYGYFLLIMLMTVRHSASYPEKVFICIVYFLFFVVETKEPFFAKANIILHLLYFYTIHSAAIRRRKTVGVSTEIPEVALAGQGG